MQPGSAITGSMKKVLIVDDDPSSRIILSRATIGLGYVPIQARNGRLAWEILQDNPDIALIASDVMMPEMSGSELIKVVRGNQVFAHMPIILVSGVAKTHEIEEILKIGAYRFLQKPLKIAEYKELLGQLIGTK